MTFSPDGNLLLTASEDKVARVWDWRVGRLAGPPVSHSTFLKHVAFDPGGTRFVTIDELLNARVWDLASGQLINLPGRHPETLSTALFPAPGIWAWEPRMDPRPAGDLVAITQLLSGRRMAGASGLVPLDREQLHNLWQAWRIR